ncbi:MAG: metalloregulator ArsR/SmtB family transcription factor [Maricaulaceae bacterium]|jgi:DNA-binding transcriptional ArsR family regulator
MIKQQPSLDRVFAALGDPTRLAIVERLLEGGETTAGDLAEPFNISKPAISRHLGVLEDAGLIEREARSRWRVARARPETLAAVDDWIARHRAFWTASLDRLADLVEPKSPKPEKPSKS